jgi:integrase
MRVWVYQDDKQVKKHGADKASWYVGWYDPEGKRCCKSCGAGEFGKREAKRLRKKRQAELLAGTYRNQAKTTWKQFRKQYEADVVPGLATRTQAEVATALNHFERLIKPHRVSALATTHIDSYITKRRVERGKYRKAKVSPATINKELRHVKAALGVAKEWGHLSALPKFRMQYEDDHLPGYVPPEHFAAIYAACDVAKRPQDLPYAAGEWWRGLLVTAYMTGWRIGALLALRREDLDMDAGVALSRAEDN